MKFLDLFILWLLFPPAFFSECKEYGVNKVIRWLLTIFSPLSLCLLYLLLLMLAMCFIFWGEDGCGHIH